MEFFVRIFGDAAIHRLYFGLEFLRVKGSGCCHGRHLLHSMQSQSKAQRRRAALDQLMDLARAGDLDATNQIVLLVAARFHARRARPQAAAALEEVGDERGERYAAVDVFFRTRSTAALVRNTDTFKPAAIPPFAIVNATDDSS